jgi:hypothetical protein
MRAMRLFAVAGFMAAFPAETEAKVFFVDPSIGSMANDGSADKPWSTLKDVLDSGKIETRKYVAKPANPPAPMVVKNPGAPVTAGDTLMLRNGLHGDILANEYYNYDFITIMAQPGHKPCVSSLELRSGCKWIVRGLTISPSFAQPYVRKKLLQLSSHNWTGPGYSYVAEACTLASVFDASSWTKAQWDTLSCDGISVTAAGSAVRNNYLKNVNFGISVSADSCLVEGNTVENFAGDGMRGLGDFCTFQYNVVKNCYAVNNNHDDGFQSWSLGDSGTVGTGVVYGMVLRGNTIINYEDANQPFRGTLQGIGCFDGMFENWLVENNVIMTDHWHGITLSGAKNCVIVNNTVVDLNTQDPGPPWIRIGAHKDSTPSTGCVVRNNLTTALNSDKGGVTVDHNIIVKNYDDYFVDYANKNLHLKSGCPAVDSGAQEFAPITDRDGARRPRGAGFDIGAYEYVNSGVIKPGEKSRSASPPFSFNAGRAAFIFKNPGAYRLEIFNQRGQCLYKLTGEGATARLTPAAPGNGAYVVKLTTREGARSGRIVVAR